jgi:hypothetical protein
MKSKTILNSMFVVLALLLFGVLSDLVQAQAPGLGAGPEGQTGVTFSNPVDERL